MRILAIDLGATSGWCLSEHEHGTWNLKTRPDESKGMKLIKLKANIMKVMEGGKIDVIFYEKPGGRHFNGIRSISNFEGVLQQFCLENDIDYRGFSATEMKKYAKQRYQSVTNEKVSGRMNKDRMVEFAKIVLGVDPIDDNHADALWLYQMAQSHFKTDKI